jgi:hypothetical protein
MKKDIFDIGFEFLLHHIGWAGVLLLFVGCIAICIKTANEKW